MLAKIKKQEGFTFAEVVVSVGIIAVVMLMFGLMLLSSANLQKEIVTTQNIDRLLAFETEQINSIRWDNLMDKPNPYSICDLDGTRFSTQSVDPGPTLVELDGTEASITRETTWYSSGVPVECQSATKNLFDAKIVTITATWFLDGEAKTKSVEVVRSRWAETPADREIQDSNVSPISLIYSDPLSNPASWGNTYVYEGASVTPCSAASHTGSSLALAFGDTNAICGVEVQGLEVGYLYTVVAEITVSVDSSPITMSAGDATEVTGLATAGGGTSVLTHTFYADGSAELVGFKIPDSASYFASTLAILSDFKVYKNN